MKTILLSALLLIAGYLTGAVGGYLVMLATASNIHDVAIHDVAVEATTSAAFIFGPAAAVFAVISGLPLLRRR